MYPTVDYRGGLYTNDAKIRTTEDKMNPPPKKKNRYSGQNTSYKETG